MNSSNPAHKPIFQTPGKPQNYNQQGQSNLKNTPQTGFDTKRRNQRDRISQSPQLITFRQSNPRLHQKTNRPYLNSSNSRPAETYYPNYQINQLLHKIKMYEQQIALLKEYIYTSDMLQRQRISEIFGFDYGCRNLIAHEESKVVLKELTIKIKHLIKQNNQLRNGQSFSNINNDDHLLIKENQRLRKIIDEYRDSQSLQYSNAKKQNIILQAQNSELNQLLLKCRNKIQLLQNEIKQNQNVTRQFTNKSSKPIIPQIPPIRQPYYTPTQQTEYAKKQLTKQMFQLEQALIQKNKANQQKIQILQRRVQRLQQLIKRYQKQRRYKIDQTMRKSFALSQNIRQMKGDDDIDILDGDETFIRQQGKIRYTQNFLLPGEKKLSDLVNPNITKSGYIKNQVIQPSVQQTSRKEPRYANDSPQKVDPRIQEIYKRQIKFANDNLAMQQLKNKNILQQNQLLRKKLQDAEVNLKERVERNIKLQGIISQLQKELFNLKKQSKRDAYIQIELRNIIQKLKSCNIQNFDLFFREFNQILEQRKQLSDIVEGYKNANQVLTKNSKNKEQLQNQRSILITKIDQLIDQNKRLIKRVSTLEAEVQSYHQQIIKNQIQKLNSIKFNEGFKPSGQQAMNFQKIVKEVIEQSLLRLRDLQSKIQNPQKQVQLPKVIQKAQKTERNPNQPRFLRLTEHRNSTK